MRGHSKDRESGGRSPRQPMASKLRHPIKEEWCNVRSGEGSNGVGGDDEDAPATEEARELGGAKGAREEGMGLAVLVDRVSNGVDGVSVEQLDISGGSRILEQFRRANRGDFFFAESGDRLKQKHFQAWQVINTAQGKGGNGGRIDALQELNADGVPLVGVDLSMAFLQGIRLKKANLSRANFAGADVRDAEMHGANLENASLRSANFRDAKMHGASLRWSVLDDADFTGAELRDTDLTGASLENTDLRSANLEGAKWGELRSVKGTNVYGVKKAPPGFVGWALGHGAVQVKEE